MTNYQRPRPHREPPPARPGLGPDSLVGLDPATASARLVAAEERTASIERSAAAQRLAERAEAAAPAPAPERPSAPAQEPESGSSTPPSRPWREGPLVVSTRRREPAPPPEFTPDELSVLARLIATERVHGSGGDDISMRL